MMIVNQKQRRRVNSFGNFDHDDDDRREKRNRGEGDEEDNEEEEELRRIGHNNHQEQQLQQLQPQPLTSHSQQQQPIGLNRKNKNPRIDIINSANNSKSHGLNKPAKQRQTIARSAAACNLCRTQKMKCEGPNHAPCKRCVRNNVECVFGESQGKARQILWTKRTDDLERRVYNIEAEIKQAHQRMDRIESLLPMRLKSESKKVCLNYDYFSSYNQQTSNNDHELQHEDPKKIKLDHDKEDFYLAESAQAFSNNDRNNSHHSDLNQPASSSLSLSSSFMKKDSGRPNQFSLSLAPSNFTDKQDFKKVSFSIVQPGKEDEEINKISNNSSNKQFFSKIKSTFIRKHKFTKAIQAGRPGPRRSDIVDRGILSELAAKDFFELHRDTWAPQIPWLNLPDTFENVRLHSPLMLAVGCSTGAKGCKDVEKYRRAKTHVIELVIDVLCYRFFPHDKPQSYQDVIAVIGCIVHCGLGLEPALVVDYAEHLRLRDVFDKIPQPEWQSESDQRQLLSIARTFIGVYIYTVLFSTLTAKPCVMKMEKSVLILYCEIICQSPYSDNEWDSNLKYFIEYYSLMEEAQIKLDSHYRLGSIDISERLSTIEKYSALVESWKQNLDQTRKSASPDANTEFKHMYHRGMTYLACFATAESRDGREIFSNRRRLRIALQGVIHAVAILQEFISSRKAQPQIPCVHLEYKKATMCIATACILEACLLIPEYIKVGNCRRVIQELTDEVEKEGGAWGGQTEDSYVTTLKTLLDQLDASIKKRSFSSEKPLSIPLELSSINQSTTVHYPRKTLVNSCGDSSNPSNVSLSTPAPPPLGNPYLSSDILTRECALIALNIWPKDFDDGGVVLDPNVGSRAIMLSESAASDYQTMGPSDLEQNHCIGQQAAWLAASETSMKSAEANVQIGRRTSIMLTEDQSEIRKFPAKNSEDSMIIDPDLPNFRWNNEDGSNTRVNQEKKYHITIAEQGQIMEQNDEVLSFNPMSPENVNYHHHQIQIHRQNQSRLEPQPQNRPHPNSHLPQLNQNCLANQMSFNHSLSSPPFGYQNNEIHNRQPQQLQQQQQQLQQQLQQQQPQQKQRDDSLSLFYDPQQQQQQQQQQQHGPNNYVVPEQTSHLLQSLRNVYPDRTFQVCFQTDS